MSGNRPNYTLLSRTSRLEACHNVSCMSFKISLTLKPFQTLFDKLLFEEFFFHSALFIEEDTITHDLTFIFPLSILHHFKASNNLLN